MRYQLDHKPTVHGCKAITALDVRSSISIGITLLALLMAARSNGGGTISHDRSTTASW